MSKIKIYIDGTEISANKNDTILKAARSAGFYIPTLCYLQKCEPIASCRLCVVEADGHDGLILACQTKVVDGLKVTINSSKLQSERQKIMELYCVNHPLECGVCDKSGECDLQNKTLEFSVNAQNFLARDQKRDIKDWGIIQYDPSLCILCEKCVHVCNEIVGDDAITIQYGGYKSTIIPKNSTDLDCTLCGECISVCPVGALISKDFKYKSNAWELKKTPSSCSHCSSACQLYYETKHDKSESLIKKVYRVTNDYEFSSLCYAGRFNFDFANSATKNDEIFDKAVNAIKSAKSIKFTSVITNEEAFLLQQLKESLGIKLINEEAYQFQQFIRAYQSTSGNQHYSASLDYVKNSDYIIVFGTKIVNDNPMVRYAINQASKRKNATVVYAHPIEDPLLSSVVTHYVKYEPASENGVMAILANMFSDKSKMQNDLLNYFNSLDLGYVSSECSFDEEEQQLVKQAMLRKKSPVIILGPDLFSHASATQIAKLAGVLEMYSEFKVLIVPPSTNTLGVSLICDLDYHQDDENIDIGYNCKGRFMLSSTLQDGDNVLDMPAMNQQEGTITNINKMVVPINVAISFDGYCLHDLVKASIPHVSTKYTIEYTKMLPKASGFIEVDFDSLKSVSKDSTEDTRGYLLISSRTHAVHSELEDIDSIGEMNGVLVYVSNPPLMFDLSIKNMSPIGVSGDVIFGSKAFMAASKISDGSIVNVEINNNSYKKKFVLDEQMKGTIALMQTNSYHYGYKIAKAKITSLES